MRKVFLLVAVIGLVFVSCSKDDEDPTFDVAKTYGTWEVIGGDNFEACPDGDNKLYEITETTIYEGQVDENGCDNGGSFGIDYEFKSGNTFDVGLGTYKITELSDNTMTLSISSLLADGSLTVKLEKY